MNTDEFLPPHDPAAEAAVIGSILIDPDAYFDVAEIVTAEMFYTARYRWMYEALTALNGRGEPVDFLTVTDELRRQGRQGEADNAMWGDLLNAVPTSISAEYYAAIVAEKATRRRLIQAAGQVAKAAYDETMPLPDAVAAAEAAVMGAAVDAGKQTLIAPRRYMSDYIDAFLSDVNAGADTRRVISTGLIDLDRVLGGLERGHQYLIAGRTSMGKSSLALGMALHAALRQGKHVAIFSLEMSEEQIVNRLISMMTRIPVARLKPQHRYQLTAAEQTAVMDAGGRISDSGIHIDTTPGLRPSDVRARAARLYAGAGLDMIVFDHMHIARATSPTGKQVQDLGSIAIELADIYKTLGVVGLTLAQLNRGVDARAIKRPQLSDLRESGQIEEAAYVAMFVHREAYYDDTAAGTAAEIIIAKNRDGATGAVDVFWKAELAQFVNAQQVQL